MRSFSLYMCYLPISFKFMTMNKYILLLIFSLFALVSCKDNSCDDSNRDNQKTLFVYMPWSNDLTSYFHQNLIDLEKSIEANGLYNERVLVFIAQKADQADFFEIKLNKGKTQRVSINTYTNHPCTTAEGIASLLSDVKRVAPASVYSMVIGCHGFGWIPVTSVGSRARSDFKHHWDYTEGPLTRYFGGKYPQYQTDITTLAQGIQDAGMKMEYILFDDCYMANVEVAYDLRHATDYLIASTCEIMAYGMPYEIIGKHLMGITNYKGIADGFYDFYSTYSYPYGALGIIDCRELDDLVPIMKEINTHYTFDNVYLASLQTLDGYSPTIFFDYGDYVDKLCTDQSLASAFYAQLDRVVPFKTHTGYYYSMSRPGRPFPITTFSGVTISDPSQSSRAVDKIHTSWYNATH